MRSQALCNLLGPRKQCFSGFYFLFFPLCWFHDPRNFHVRAFHHTQRSAFFRSEPLLFVISLIQQPKLYGNILSLSLRAVLSVPSNRVSKKPGAEQSFWEGRGESVMEQPCHRATGSGGKPRRRRRRCKGTTWMSTTSCSPASLPLRALHSRDPSYSSSGIALLPHSRGRDSPLANLALSHHPKPSVCLQPWGS